MGRRANQVAELDRIEGEVRELLSDMEDFKLVSPQVPHERPGRFRVEALLAGKKRWRAGEVVERVGSALLGQSPSPTVRRALLAELKADEPINPDRPADRTRVKRMLKVLMSLPEFQLG